MQLFRNGKHLLAALLLAIGLIGGVASMTVANPLTSGHNGAALLQDGTPAASPTADCEDDDHGDDHSADGRHDGDNGTPEATDDQGDASDDDADHEDADHENGTPEAQDSNDDANDDHENGTPEAEDGHDDANSNDANDSNEQGSCDDDGSDSGQPGELMDGQDLQSQATVSLEDAIATAQAAATGDLGTVDLEEEDGTLVYKVTIGDQEVIIDAATGEVLGIEPVD